MFDEYVRFCIQRHPHYGVKHPNGHWCTKNKALSDRPIQAHLQGKYAVAVVGQWYPQFINFDIDDRPLEYVQEIRNDLGLDERNSALYTSESPDCYHLLVLPQYNGERPSLRMLQWVCKGYAGYKGIEIYPQESRLMRLPFGPRQRCLDVGREYLEEWDKKLYWTLKLDEFDLSTMPQHQMILPYEQPAAAPQKRLTTYREGQEYLEHGLQAPSTRHYAQFCIAYYLWRHNTPQDEAMQTVWRWLQAKHNGFSKDLLRWPKRCKDEIGRQVEHVYTKYDSRWLLPDSAHNGTRGYITKPDIEQIMQVSRGNLPRMKFAYELVKYAYPRRHKPTMNIHSNKLRSWAGTRTLDTYLGELQEKNIINRGSSYLVGIRSKELSINWPFNSTGHAIMYEGRAVDAFKDAVQMVFKPEEFQERVKAAGASPAASCMMKNSIFADDEGESILSGPST